MKSWEQFFCFGLVGVLGFAVDASTLTIMLAANAGLFWGRAISYLAAASCTWALNRRWTFDDGSSRGARQWAKFLAVSSCGGLVNYGVYAPLVLRLNGLSVIFPVFAAAVGSICGLTINFHLSKRMVFEKASAKVT